LPEPLGEKPQDDQRCVAATSWHVACLYTAGPDGQVYKAQRVGPALQRAREERIIERLHGGTLALAHPTDTAQATPAGDARCYGCLEPDPDVHVGDHSWHSLCVLFWQGRSENLRSRPIPHTQPGHGISPARSRWVLVVSVGRPDAFAMLRRRFGRSPWVDVVIDRRRGERRQEGQSPVERRLAGQRPPAVREPAVHATEPIFRLAHRVDGCDLYESTGPESGRCPECGGLVSVELPRFVEPPIRLELTVCHEKTVAAWRHVVELQSLSATGRVLFATRIVARTSGPARNESAPRDLAMQG
jgi:hypothetical protein